jgi:hypothetical protein
MAECAHCGKDGTKTPIIEVCLCEECADLYQAKDVEFMQWLVAPRGTWAR